MNFQGKVITFLRIKSSKVFSYGDYLEAYFRAIYRFIVILYTYIHTYVHTFIHMYIHTYIHIHVDTQALTFVNTGLSKIV